MTDGTLTAGTAETVRVREFIRIQLRDGETGKVLSEFRGGEEERRSVGDWMNKQRIVDNRTGAYLELVTDQATCEVVHFCFEPLIAHRGHGTLKPGPAEPEDHHHG